jgi:hypothetical protein
MDLVPRSWCGKVFRLDELEFNAGYVHNDDLGRKHFNIIMG